MPAAQPKAKIGDPCCEPNCRRLVEYVYTGRCAPCHEDFIRREMREGQQRMIDDLRRAGLDVLQNDYGNARDFNDRFPRSC